MPRRFAEGTERPDPAELRDWQSGQLFDEEGECRFEEVDVLLRELLDTPHATISAIVLSRRTFIDPFQVRCLCRQLVTFRILEESPPMSFCFRLRDDERPASLLAKIRNRLEARKAEASAVTKR